MRLENHMFIAEESSKIIEQHVGVSFNKKLLRLGACMPDIQPLRRIQIHSPKLVGEHFDREYRRIVYSDKKINRISFILGLLSHYISDAFCLSHNLYTVDMKKHIQYEYLLNDYTFKTDLSSKMNDWVENKIQWIQQSNLSVAEYIEQMNHNYLERIKNLTWEEIMPIDLEQSILHSSALLSNFVFELQSIPVTAVCIA
ncbi:MAG: zinc dependent phospholipase C family protein [Epulopiscium sp.]|nr:zinc dependent phospholipase C family protein [Candidatus Epulonipiscium sp.]